MQLCATTHAPRLSRYWSRSAGLARMLLLAAMLALVLTGCETTGNVPPGHDISAHRNSGLVLFSVTHDKDYKHLARRGANIRFSVTFRNVDKNIDTQPAFSNEMMALIVTSPFENVWGRVYVREFAAGRYELSGWRLEQNTGSGLITITAEKPPVPIAFEVRAGSVMYIGNVHGSLEWGKRKVLGFIELVSGVNPQIRNEADRDEKVILKDYPQLAGKIVVAPLPGGPWQGDGARSATFLSEAQNMQTCMRYEEPLALQRMGQGEIKSAADATAYARMVCGALAQTCVNEPLSDKCRSALSPFGLASEQGVSSGSAVLLNAATRGESETVRTLLASGMGPDVRNVVEWTPLMLAAAERHTDTVKVLLEAGADPNAVNVFGRTALMFASAYGQDAIVKLLLDRGAKPDIVPNDHSGWTALMAAAARGHGSTVTLLLQNGADPDIKSKEGKTAVEHAQAEGHSEVVRRFLVHKLGE